MPDPASIDRLLRSKRKKPLFDPADLPVKLNYSQEFIKKIIPHRSPLLFVDRLTGLNLEQGLISGERFMNPSDPVFAGHFPDLPLYPGNFVMEMIGQLALCMNYFEAQQRTDIAPDAKPIANRLIKAQAYYLEPIYPGVTVSILAQKLFMDEYSISLIGQALVNGKVAVVTSGEALIF
ncbi:MAG: 3-hydroxyacyl-ACP dehydratase FabZ family protein [Salinispira sp.]